MAQSYIHAQASARHFGGQPEDYIAIHEWIDQFKASLGDVRHRAMLHHAKGPWMAQEVFGRFINIRDENGNVILDRHGRPVKILVRDIAENHITEDMGCIPEVGDWLCNMTCRAWMGGKKNKFIGREDLLEAEVKIPQLARGDEQP